MVGLDPEMLSMIYEAAAIPSAWPDVLSRLAAMVQAFGGALVAINGSPTLSFVSTESYRPSYETYRSVPGKHRNPRAERALARRYFGFLPDTDLCSVSELEADPLYREVLFPFGIGWTIGCPIPAPTSDLVYFDICRLKKDEPFTLAEASLLDAYRPYLARASLIATRLRLEQARAATEALAWVGLPVALLASAGKAIAANQLFEALDPRLVVGPFDRLVITDQRVSAAIHAVLAQTPETFEHLTPLSLPVAAGANGESALVVHLIPVQGSAADVFVGAMWVILVTPVVAPRSPLSGVISGLFDLTPSEAQVAQDVTDGKTVQAIAMSRGLSVETVRSQLKAAFAKTGTSRQVDLARLLLGAVLPLQRSRPHPNG